MTETNTLPFAWYTDEEQLRRERARIFARAWQYAGRAEDVARPGLVPRDRCWRACRSSSPATPTGSCARSSTSAAIVAPCSPRAAARGARSSATTTRGRTGSTARYAQRRAPTASRGSTTSEWSLLPASVGTWGPFLFVNPEPHAPPLAEQLGELPEILARDIDVDDARLPLARRVRRRGELEDRGRELPRVLSLRDRASGVQRRGRRASRTATCSRRIRRSARSSAGRRRRASRASSTCSTRTPASTSSRGRSNLSIGPIAAQRARTARSATWTTSSPRTSTRTGWREFFAFDDQVGRRTRALVESVQRGMASGMLEHGRLLLDAEPLLAAFQGWVRERLA